MTNRTITSHCLSVAALFAGLCASASATVVEYTTQSSFTTATSGVSTITFDGPASNSVVSYGNSSGYTSDSVNFIGYDNAAGPSSYDLRDENVTPTWSGAYLDGPGSFGPSANAGITAFLPANTFAVGTNIMAAGHDPGTGAPISDAVNYQVILSTDSTVYTITSLAGFSSMAFVGFTSDTAITSITFRPQSADHIDLDNFQFGQVAGSSGSNGTSDTPEAATLLLCGAGLCMMAHVLRRRGNLVPLTA